MAKNTTSLKGLKIQADKIGEQLSALRVQQKTINRDVSEKQSQLDAIKNRINQLSSKELRVTDHAIIRYLERVKGMDIQAIREEIITDEVKRLTNELGPNGKYPANSEFSVTVQNNAIVTVLNN